MSFGFKTELTTAHPFIPSRDIGGYLSNKSRLDVGYLDINDIWCVQSALSPNDFKNNLYTPNVVYIPITYIK